MFGTFNSVLENRFITEWNIAVTAQQHCLVVTFSKKNLPTNRLEKN